MDKTSITILAEAPEAQNSIQVNLILSYEPSIDSYGEDGKPIYGEPDSAKMFAQLNGIVEMMAQAGYKRRADSGPRWQGNRGGGGGQKPPEATPPADLAEQIPECDGEKMEYRASYQNRDGKQVGARFVCRKAAQCSEARNGYGKAVWEDALRRQIEEAGKPQVECPDCGGPMWDNRPKKATGQFKDTAPDFACKDKDNCGGRIWHEGEPFGPASGRTANAQAIAREPDDLPFE